MQKVNLPFITKIVMYEDNKQKLPMIDPFGTT